jgi:hypothetical protein
MATFTQLQQVVLCVVLLLINLASAQSRKSNFFKVLLFTKC